MEISTRPHWTAGTAVTAAAITLAPLIAGPSALHAPTLPISLPPAVSVPQVQLAAVISPTDIDNLVDRLNSALASVSSTVTAAVAMPANSLTSALDSAVSVNNSLWDGLIDATDSRSLVDLLNALRATSSGSLSRLSTTVGDTGAAVVLTTGEVTDLLASALTGSLSTALHAVATIVNNPLALASYTGLLNAPLDIAGLVVNNGLSLVDSVGSGALSVTSTLVTGVTSQIDNILRGVNGLIDAAKGAVPGVALLDGVLTAVQGIVSAPVTAALAGVDGVAGTLTSAASRVVSKLAGGASEIGATWLGDGTASGALQEAINAIGAAPLSAASYTRALGVVVSAGISSVRSVASAGASLLSVPFTAGADLTSTASAMITRFTDGVATAASGILHAAGLPSFVSSLPHALATTINITVRAVSFGVSTGLNAVATVLDIGSAIAGSSTPTLSREASSRVLIDVPTLTASSAGPTAGAEEPSPEADTAPSPMAGEGHPATVADEAPLASAGAPEAPHADMAVSLPAVDGTPVEVEQELGDADTGQLTSLTSTSSAGDPSPQGSAALDPDTSDAEALTRPTAHSAASEGDDAATTRPTARPAKDADEASPGDRADTHGRHASGETASNSSGTATGRHRSDSPSSASNSQKPSNSRVGSDNDRAGKGEAAA
ncbi:hypothetical protein ACNUDN_31330 (plasmid) [Mycobacterium sp. smrl_JER01]|uniref:hypothetical protein n=1 Tax=Mycobacterium sp. smrl_JER01 TaxID=3402633 RepID=UPI003ACDF63F